MRWKSAGRARTWAWAISSTRMPSLLYHLGVVDMLVVSRPNERFGKEVVAIMQPRTDTDPVSPHDLRKFVATTIARFKAPRAVAFCDMIGRHPNGKPNYKWARTMAESATPVSDPS